MEETNIFEQHAASQLHGPQAPLGRLSPPSHSAVAASPPSNLSRQHTTPQQPQPMSCEGGNCTSVYKQQNFWDVSQIPRSCELHSSLHSHPHGGHSSPPH